MQPSLSNRLIILFATLAACVATYFLARTHLEEMSARALSIFVLAVVFWATEVLPLFATAFVVIGLQIVALAHDGGLAGELSDFLRWLGLEVRERPGSEPLGAGLFLGAFSQDTVILLMGGLLLSRALSRNGIDVEVARRILGPLARSPRGALWTLLSMSAFFSMWMSNTAATAMLLAMSRPLVSGLDSESRFRTALILAIPFGANIGGIGTPIGTPPNAIAFGALRAAGYPVTFLSWTLVAVPLAVLLLMALGALLLRLFPPDEAASLSIPEPREGMSGLGVASLVVTGLAISLWLSSGLHGLSPGVVALLAAGALSALGALDRDDLAAIDWSVLVLVWGGLSLGVAVSMSGLSQSIASLGVAELPGGIWTTGLFVAAAAVLMSTFMSNTATAALLVPATLALALPDREQVAMLAAICCSFAMALPVSTPPNAIAYSTGDVPLSEMKRVGLRVSILSTAIALFGYRIVLPLVF